MDKPKMICPKCGAQMNHHASKVEYNVDDPSLIDPMFGGVVEEIYTCPHCGNIVLQHA